MTFYKLSIFLCAWFAGMDGIWGEHCNPDVPGITVGGPLSILNGSRYSSTGRNMYQALLLFQDWVNDDYGGFHINNQSRCLNLLIQDDQSLKANVENITRSLLEAHSVHFIFAPYSSDLTDAAARIADEYQTITLAAGSATKLVFEGKQYLFGSLTAADTSLSSILSALSDKGATTIGYFYEDQSYTTEVCGAIPSIAGSLPTQLEVVGAFKVPANPNASTIAQVLNHFIQVEPDIFVGCTYFDACAMTLQQMEQLRFMPKAQIFTLCATDSSFFSTIGHEGLYTLTGTQWDSSMAYSDEYTGWQASDFESLYMGKWGEKPAYQGAATFALMEALLKAVESAGELDMRAVSYWLSRHKLTSFYGPLNFDYLNMNDAGLAYVQVFDHQETALVLPHTIAEKPVAYPIDCLVVHGENSCECSVEGCRDCTAEDYDTKYSDCTSSMERDVYVSLQPDADCVEKTSKSGTYSLTCPFTPYMSSAGWSIISLSALTITSSFVALGWIIYKRTHKVLIASQPTFLGLFCIGISLLGLSVGFTPGKLTSEKCSASLWLGGIGFTLAFGSLALKVFRVYRIFGNATLTRVRVREQDVLKGLVAMILLDVAVLTFVTTMETPEVRTRISYIHSDIVKVEECSCDYGRKAGITIFLGTKVALLLHGLYLSFKTRHVDSRFERSGMVMMAMYQYAIGLILYLLITQTADLTPWQLQLSFSSILTFAAVSSMGFIVLTKVIMCYDTGAQSPLVATASSSRVTSGRYQLQQQAQQQQQSLTHKQFMDIVFSPADIIDMNERIAFLEAENCKLAKQVHLNKARTQSHDPKSRESLSALRSSTPLGFASRFSSSGRSSSPDIAAEVESEAFTQL